MGFNATFAKKNKETGDVEKTTQTVKTKIMIVYNKNELNEALDKLFNNLQKLFEILKLIKSGFTLETIHYLLNRCIINLLEILLIFQHLRNLAILNVV